jgi:hypothetical protein
MSQTTSSQFSQAISIIKDRGDSSEGVWFYLTFTLKNDIIPSDGSPMLGYLIAEEGSNSVATMTWEDVVSDPDGIIANIIA